jgi:hypothetical protein
MDRTQISGTDTESPGKKPVYRTPTVLDLNDVQEGQGFCESGSTDAEACWNGTSATGGCESGISP